MERISGGQLSRKAKAALLSSHILGRRRPTGALLVSPRTRRSSRESARRQPEALPAGSDVTAQTPETMTVTAVSERDSCWGLAVAPIEDQGAAR